MNKLLVLLVLLLMPSIVYAEGVRTLNCDWRSADTCSADNSILYAHKDFSDADGKVLSSQTSLTRDSNYAITLCCEPTVGTLRFWNTPGKECGSSAKSLMYFTGEKNARVAFNYTSAHHSHALCVDYTHEFTNMDVFWTDSLEKSRRYSEIGYTCLFRTNDKVNGHISDCNATFGPGDDSYSHSVWARLWENSDNIQCNADCTSKLDDRIYGACGEKIEACRDIYPGCEGSLKGAWVEYNTSHEIECKGPWDNLRPKVFSGSDIEIDTSDTCKNVINRKYTVVVDNEHVTMNIYICGD